MKRAIGYALVFVWSALCCALQLVTLGLAPRACAETATATSTTLVRMGVPDLATIFLVAAVGRLARRDLVAIAVTAAAARIAFTAAPPFAVLAGTLAVALVADFVRGFAELDAPGLRVAATALGSFVYAAWLMLVDASRAAEMHIVNPVSPLGSGGGALDAAAFLGPFLTGATTAVIAFALWPLFRSLPGLRRLERRAF